MKSMGVKEMSEMRLAIYLILPGILFAAIQLGLRTHAEAQQHTSDRAECAKVDAVAFSLIEDAGSAQTTSGDYLFTLYLILLDARKQCSDARWAMGLDLYKSIIDDKKLAQ